MVISEVTRTRIRRDKAPAVNISALPKVHDASESLQANPQAVSPSPHEREPYITVDTLKNFMSTMMDVSTARL